MPGDPFAIVTTHDGRWSFASLGPRIGLFSDDSFVPRLVRQFPVPGTSAGMALTADGSDLVVADSGSGATVMDVAAAIAGTEGAVVGTMTDPGRSGATGVAISPDERYAFVTQEKSSALDVFDLAAAIDGKSPTLVGAAPLGPAPVGVAVSPDGKWLYATSQGGSGRDGLLSVLDLHRAETDPAHSVVASAAAGCSPVRVVVSADGTVVWVTARGSNTVLAFDAAVLRTSSTHARLAEVAVGAAPVALAFIGDGRYLLVTDSNRFSGSAAGDVRIVDLAAALARRPAVVARVEGGGFPRDVAVEPGRNTILVANYGSQEIQAIDAAQITERGQPTGSPSPAPLGR